MRCEDHPRATAARGLRFGCMEECLSQAIASMVLIDPEVGDFGAASPSVASQTCNDFAGLILNACPKKPSIKVTRYLGVELVDARDEESIQRLPLSFVQEHNSLRLHGS